MAGPDDTGNVIDLIADSLTLERPDLVRQIFNAAGARTPEVI